MTGDPKSKDEGRNWEEVGSSVRIQKVLRRARRQVAARDTIGLGLAGFGAVVMVIVTLLHMLWKPRRRAGIGHEPPHTDRSA